MHRPTKKATSESSQDLGKLPILCHPSSPETQTDIKQFSLARSFVTSSFAFKSCLGLSFWSISGRLLLAEVGISPRIPSSREPRPEDPIRSLIRHIGFKGSILQTILKQLFRRFSLAKESQTRTGSTEKLRNTRLYEKAARKMLMKLTRRVVAQAVDWKGDPCWRGYHIVFSIWSTNY